jgi:predicted phosphodiesterase
MKSYWPEKGLAAESPVHSFTTLDRRKPAISFAAITDTHEDVARLNGLVKPIDWNSTDFLVHLGDAFHGIESEEAIWTRFLDPITRVLAFTKPLVYARGNHEARGAGARSLIDYVPIPEGRFYYARDHGPVHFVVLDTGEDKDDNTNVYSRLNSFKRYRDEELAWFDRHVRTSRRIGEAPFRVLLMHAPNWGWTANQGAKWTEAANSGKFDLSISGHTHRFSHSLPGQKGNQYHELVIGPDNLARVEATDRELRVRVTTRDGKEVETFTVARRGP